ncbi:MAG: hypothetical protein RL026_1533 [Pseudomonadota bacterium]
MPDNLPRNARPVGRAFSRAAPTYDDVASLQQQVRAGLLERLEVLPARPAVVLDLGAGTGGATRELKRRYGRATVVGLDLATGMLRQLAARSWPWRRLHAVQADAAALPLAAASVDLVFSNLMLQWCQPPDAALAEIRRVLRPGGLLLLSSFGPATLQELRRAWAAVDDAPHVNEFTDLLDLGAALQRAGFHEPVLDVDRVCRFVPDWRTLALQLRGMGANHVPGRAPGLAGRQRLQAMQAAYESFRQPQGLPVSWEIVNAVAWAPAAAVRQEQPGEQVFGLDQLRQRLRTRRQEH